MAGRTSNAAVQGGNAKSASVSGCGFFIARVLGAGSGLNSDANQRDANDDDHQGT
jgi:hypothetical protein